MREGVTSSQALRTQALECEVKELRRATEILKPASAFFTQAELHHWLECVASWTCTASIMGSGQSAVRCPEAPGTLENSRGRRAGDLGMGSLTHANQSAQNPRRFTGSISPKYKYTGWTGTISGHENACSSTSCSSH